MKALHIHRVYKWVYLMLKTILTPKTKVVCPKEQMLSNLYYRYILSLLKPNIIIHHPISVTNTGKYSTFEQGDHYKQANIGLGQKMGFDPYYTYFPPLKFFNASMDLPISVTNT